MIMNGKTQLIGIIGWPVSHSFSPAMHNAAAADLGINWAYLPLPVHPDLVAEAMAGLPALGLRGANVTVPHKQAIIPHLHGLGEGARAIGAVNTIVVGAGGSAEPLRPTSDSPLTGYNTDWTGFLDDLATADVDVADRDCLVLGAGGSARAVVYALAQRGGRVRVLARRIEQAQSLVADLAPFVADATLAANALGELAAISAESYAPLIVNTTPLGMTPNVTTTPWPDEVAFPRGSFAYDLVYTPAETRFMVQATAAGCRAANGLGMLVQQGAHAFKLWTGMDPNLDVMAAALNLS